jgi:hypothetical protein
MRLTHLFSEAAKEVQSLLHFEDIANNGLRQASKASETLDLIRRANEALEREDHPLNDPAKFNEFRDKAQKLQTWAGSQAQPGFPYLYELLLIRLWCILENLIEQLTTARLHHISALDQHEALARLKVSILDYIALDQVEKGAYLYEELCKTIGTKERRGAGKYEAVLAAVGLSGPIVDLPSRMLLEASVVRNLVIHRGGRVDRRSEKACPWLSTTFGARIRLDPRFFYRYALAVRWYIQEIDRRAGELVPQHVVLGYPTSQEQLLDTLADLCVDETTNA